MENKAKAILIDHYGGPEILKLKEISVSAPGPGEALVRHSAIGLNFIDVYHRRGLYPLPSLPAVLGSEAAGRVEAVGPGVAEIAAGDRVAYAGGPTGAYSEARVIPAHRLVKLPEGISDPQAAAMMLKGMTAEYLLRRTYVVKPGDVILFHAAAGGVGTIACQWAKQLGATVIGTVGSRKKAPIAAAHGCDHVIVTGEEDFVARVREITRGEGVPVVYDSVGKDTFMRSLDCLRPRGMIVSFGQSSGMVPPLEITILSTKGSLFLTRPTLMHYTAKREDLLACAAALFDAVLHDGVKIEIGRTYSLQDASKAHADLESRKTTGSTVLIP
ncbi:MAG: quinone oxidoreductase [Nitrospirae bacterium]|nr:quinone oxidoreductase [Nitrospirota bacterium]